MDIPTPRAKSMKGKPSKSSEPRVRRMMSDYFDKKSLKAKISKHFSREPPVPSIRPEDIHVLRDEDGNTISHWPIPTCIVSTPARGPTARSQNVDEQGPAWLASPTLTSPIPPGPHAPVTGTTCFIESPPSVYHGISNMQEIKQRDFGNQFVEYNVQNATAQPPPEEFSIVYHDEEPFLEAPVEPLRVNKKRESPDTEAGLAERDEYYPSVAPLSTPRRRLASQNAGDLPEQSPSSNTYFEYPESPLQSHKRLYEEILENSNISRENSGNLLEDDDDDEFSESSSCYSKKPDDYCHKHQSKLPVSSGVSAGNSYDYFTPELNQESSSQAAVGQDIKSPHGKAICYNKPYYNYAEVAAKITNEDQQTRTPMRENKNESNSETPRRGTGSMESMDVQRDSSTLIASPQQTTVPPIPEPNVAPLPALSPAECDEEKGNRRDGRAKFSFNAHKRVTEFVGRAFRKIGEGFSKLGKHNEEENDEEPGPTTAEVEVHQLIREQLDRGRECPTRARTVPNAWIFRDEQGFFDNRSNEIRDRARDHGFSEMLCEPSGSH